MKWIVVAPEGGIGNRLRVLASAIIAAEQHNRRVLLIWKQSRECRSAYHDIFEPSSLYRVAPWWRVRLAESAHGRAGIPLPVSLLPIASKGGRSLSVINTDRMAELRFHVPPSEIDDYSVVYFDEVFWDFIPQGMSHETFDQKTKAILKQIVPASKIASRLFDIPSPKVGVHIRHYKAPDAIRISSLERFIAAMESCVAKDPRTKFFLATDVPEVEATLRDRFSDRIVSSPKLSYKRDEAGIYDALVDLYMLSRCDRVLGSYWSSFSEYAALIGGTSLDVIGVGPSPGPAHGILKRAEKYEKYGSEGWAQGWTPEGPPPGWTPDGSPAATT